LCRRELLWISGAGLLRQLQIAFLSPIQQCQGTEVTSEHSGLASSFFSNHQTPAGRGVAPLCQLSNVKIFSGKIVTGDGVVVECCVGACLLQLCVVSVKYLTTVFLCWRIVIVHARMIDRWITPK